MSSAPDTAPLARLVPVDDTHFAEDSSRKAMDLPRGETILGRGPLLDITDARVSRTHAKIMIDADGSAHLMPTHKSVCCVKTKAGSEFSKTRAHEWIALDSGDVLSFISGAHFYRIDNLVLAASKGAAAPPSPPSHASLRQAHQQSPPAPAPAPQHHSQPKTASALADSDDGDTSGQTSGHKQVARSSSLTLQRETSSQKSVSSLVKSQSALEDLDDTLPPKPKVRRTLPWSSSADASASSTATKGARKGKSKADGDGDGDGDEDDEPVKKPAKPKQSQRKSDSSSDSEAPSAPLTKATSSTKKASAAVDSEEDSPAPLKKAASTKSTAKSSRAHADSDDDASASTSAAKKPAAAKSASSSSAAADKEPCPFGKNCYRKNPQHFVQFSHGSDDEGDGDSDTGRSAARSSSTRTKRRAGAGASDDEDDDNDDDDDDGAYSAKGKRTRSARSGKDSDSEDDAAPSKRSQSRKKARMDDSDEADSDDGNDGSLPVCSYGAQCYRKNPQHFLQFYHPKKSGVIQRRSQRAARGTRSADRTSVLEGDEDDDGKPNEYDLTDSFIDDQDEDGGGDGSGNDSEDDDNDNNWRRARKGGHRRSEDSADSDNVVSESEEDIQSMIREAQSFKRNKKLWK